MTKLYTQIEEIEHCGECVWAEFDGVGSSGWFCDSHPEYEDRGIKDLWGEIPEWCPLPDKGNYG